MTHRGMISQSVANALGLVQVVACPFAFDTPGLADGAPIYTPIIGDWLLNAWLHIPEAWDGTSQCDVYADIEGTPFFGSGGQDLSSSTVGGNTFGGALGTRLQELALAAQANQKDVPARFATIDPISVVVSQDGTPGGGDSDATQGSAILYLVIARPALAD